MLSVRLLTLTHTVFKPTADSILWTLTHGLEEKQLFILHINENYRVLCGFVSGPEVGRLQCLSNLMKPLQHLCLVPTSFNELKERLFKLFLVEAEHLSQYQTDTEAHGEARNACSIRPTQPPPPSSSLFLQTLFTRTWKWGQTGRATTLRARLLMRCSRLQVFVWGTEGTDVSLQR